MSSQKYETRKKRHNRVRSKIKGTAARPRLVVFRSLLHIYAQLINDEEGKTICLATDQKEKKGTKLEKAKAVGADIAKKAKENNINSVVFDRNGYKYHGRIKALAEAAREGGLKL